MSLNPVNSIPILDLGNLTTELEIGLLLLELPVIADSVVSGISGVTNCLMALYAISTSLKLPIFLKNDVGNGVICSGKYKPLSGASPFITAFLKLVIGAFLFKE